jgi:hypothetical protein
MNHDAATQRACLKGSQAVDGFAIDSFANGQVGWSNERGRV